MLEHDLRAAEHVPGRQQAHRDVADRYALAIGERLQRAARRLAIALAHDRERLGSGKHGSFPGRAWSPWPWVMTARATGSCGSMWKSPGAQ